MYYYICQKSLWHLATRSRSEIQKVQKGDAMNRKEQMKCAAWGAVVGAVLIMVIGFSWFGWTLDSTAKKMAAEQVNTAVIGVLTPQCVERFMNQPGAAAKLTELKAIQSWQRSEVIEKGGWATPAGAKSPNSEVARACAEKLAGS